VVTRQIFVQKSIYLYTSSPDFPISGIDQIT